MDFTIWVLSIEEEVTIYRMGILAKGTTLHFDVVVDAEEQELGVVPWMSTQHLCGEPFGGLLLAGSSDYQGRVRPWRHL